VRPLAARGSAARGRTWGQSQAWRPLLPVALVAAGPVAVAVADQATGRSLFPALLCLLAIGGATAAGGRAHGIAAAIASFVAFNFYFTPPRHEFGAASWEGAAAALLFGITAVAISVLIARERLARSEADDARRAAEAAQERAERLQRLASVLAEAITPQDVLDATLSEGVAAADARAGLLAVVSKNGRFLEVVAQRGYDDDLVGDQAPFHRFPIAAELPLSEAVRMHEPVFVDSQRERDARYPQLAGVAGEAHAVACLPLVLEGRAIGGLVFSFARDRIFDDERRALKIAIANQVAQALGRARLYELADAAHRRAAFLAEATALLSSSLDYEETLERLAQLAVPDLADWCSIDMVGEDGGIERLAVAHQDPGKVAWGKELQERFPPDPDDSQGVPHVLRTGEAEFLPEIPQELLDQATQRNPELGEVIEQLGLHSWICVPLMARGRTLGALSLVAAESGRTFEQADFELALELADRAAVAVDNATLYRESERRGDAARALAHTADGVVLLDLEGRIRYWNPAVATLTGIDEHAAMGRPIADVLPAWRDLTHHLDTTLAGEPTRRATLPLSAGEDERWVSVTAVQFEEGAVYALRDVTEERRLEQARSDFVATASHELRTPIAAVYGAVRTLQRQDVEFSESDRELFLQIIETEGERLGSLVDQILVAGQIDAGTVHVHERPCHVVELAESVVASTRLRAPGNIELELEAEEAVPPLGCDEDKLRQVLHNLVENAVKYSPEGGRVTVAVSANADHGRIAVHDEGLGIPASEQERIFEKFYRLDPSLTRGVGGSGLGLYISRELVERMSGRLTVSSEPGRGSTFVVELPRA
jgi:PAS domain S-box-containing protein